MATVKLSALALIAAASISATDILPITDSDAGTPTTYKISMAAMRTAVLQASVGTGWGATDYLGLGTGTAPTTGMVRAGLGAITADTPLLNSTATWNNVAITFRHLLVNITDTNSAAGSLFADYQVAGASKWSVSKAGAVTQAGALTVSAGTTAVQALTAASITTAGVLTVTGAFTSSGAVLTGDSGANKDISIRPGGASGIIAFLNSGGFTLGTFNAANNFTVINTATIGTGLTVSAGGASVAGTSTFTGSVAIAGTANTLAFPVGAGSFGDPLGFGVSSAGDKAILYNDATYDGRIGVGTTTNLWIKSVGVGVTPATVDFHVGNVTNGVVKQLSITRTGVAVAGTLSGVTTLTATTLAGTLSTAAQPNVTSLGTLTSLVLSGTISGVTTLTATTLAGTLSTAAQPNITSTGTLGTLTVSGAGSLGTLTLTGSGGKAVFPTGAGSFGDPLGFNTDSAGDKAVWYNDAGSSYDARLGVGTTANLWIKAIGVGAGGSSIDFHVGNVTNGVTKQLSVTRTGVTLAGTLSGVTTLTATSLGGTLTTAAQANVTSVGTLTSLALAGALAGTASQHSEYAWSISNPDTTATDFGTQASLQFAVGGVSVGSLKTTQRDLTTLTGRSLYLTTMGAYHIAFGINNVSTPVGYFHGTTGVFNALQGITVAAGGIIVTGASTITGTLGGITTLTATTLAGTLSTAAQPNVTSLGTLASLTVTAAIVGSVTGSAATVTGAAQTAITSLGTLTGLTVGGTLVATTHNSVTGTASVTTATATTVVSVAPPATTDGLYLVMAQIPGTVQGAYAIIAAGATAGTSNIAFATAGGGNITVIGITLAGAVQVTQNTGGTVTVRVTVLRLS